MKRLTEFEVERLKEVVIECVMASGNFRRLVKGSEYFEDDNEAEELRIELSQVTVDLIRYKDRVDEYYSQINKQL